MEIKLTAKAPDRLEVDCLTLLIFDEDEDVLLGPVAEIDAKLDGLISSLVSNKEFKGKLGQTSIIHQPAGLTARRLLLLGGGKTGTFGIRGLERAAGVAARQTRARGLTSLGILLALPESSPLAGDSQTQARIVGEAVTMALYQGDQYKEKPEKRQLEQLYIMGLGTGKRVSQAANNGLTVGTCTNIARNLINTPGNDLPPKALAKHAKAVAYEYGLDYRELDRKAMEKLGMGSLLGVAKGSATKPRMIVLTYTPDSPNAKNETKETLALVGKGITFDTGGISLKPSKSMEKMKYDMAGGAAVLGAMAAIGQLKPQVRVVGVVPAVENMPGGLAQRPGDVVKAASGKTVEVINTDAEGRLILADALWYAREKLGASHMVDLATLTGAVSIALGNVFIGLMGNNNQMIKRVKAAGKLSSERYWQLPLDDEYKKQLKSDIADMKNVGGPKAGTITAGYFLKEFADPIPWAHLDIAGTAWSDKAKGHLASGGTGVGVRTLVNLAMGWE